MVLNRSDNMKRKRKDVDLCSLLDDSPKRTKVHAQRKFAQGSNVNSPVLTPVQEIEKPERKDVLPEPIDLLPMNRPNTEDFLTFLCFRGTPILPSNLNFFNTASTIHSTIQAAEPLNISPRTSTTTSTLITKPGAISTQNGRPFIAFGVRKRADPIVISKQMDRKRRHALALQALRRKYQEQKMAKIRAVTISKLSEKINTTKNVVRTTRSVTKSEAITKKNINHKTKVKVISTKRVKVTKLTTIKQPIQVRTNVKPKMCLRSFRGRFVQRELSLSGVKKRPLPKKSLKKVINKEEKKTKEQSSSEFSSDDDEPLVRAMKKPKIKVPIARVAKKSALGPKKPSEIKLTRSKHILMNKQLNINQRSIKKKILISSTKLVKSPTTRSSMITKSKQLTKEIEKKKGKVIEKIKERILRRNTHNEIETKSEKEYEKKEIAKKKTVKEVEKKKTQIEMEKKKTELEQTKIEKSLEKKEKKAEKNVDKDGEKKKVEKIISKEVEKRKSEKLVEKENEKKKTEKSIERDSERKKVERTTDKENEKKKTEKIDKDNEKKAEKTIDKDGEKKKLEKNVDKEGDKRKIEKIVDKEVEKKKNEKIIEREVEKKKIEKITEKDSIERKKNEKIIEKEVEKKKTEKVNEKDVVERKKNEKIIEKEVEKKKTEKVLDKKKMDGKKGNEKETELEVKVSKPNTRTNKKELLLPEKKDEAESSKVKNKTKKEIADAKPKKEVKKIDKAIVDNIQKESQPNKQKRPTRKTKEAAAIYMEILGHKLASEEENNEDNISIDSFPELPNVRKTEQRENELKAKVTKKSDKKQEDAELELVSKKMKTVSKTNLSAPLKSLKSEKIASVQNSEIISDKNIELKESKEVEKKILRNNKTDMKTDKKSMRSSVADSLILFSDSDDNIAISNKFNKHKRLKAGSLSSRSESGKNKKLQTKRKIKKPKATFESDSEESTTSDVNKEKIEERKNVPKKKIVSNASLEESFSDSDEEPLSKFTAKTEKLGSKSNEYDGLKKKGDVLNVLKDDVKIDLPTYGKPKRECTKRPQNYLTLFSSSDDEDKFFHGFVKSETKPKIIKLQEEKCTHTLPSIDLLCKDVGRRFGKGKVNMSTEQIEKWLKDSALAGACVKNENDEMLKFGEKIPTETSLEVHEIIDTENLKSSLLSTKSSETEKNKSETCTSTENTKSISEKPPSKPVSNEKKIIFKKEKKDTPNLNAFNANNESSVYAFEADNEDSVKTPFRRPSRRPSSATSRSEDDISKNDDSSKFLTKFRLPTMLKADSLKLPATKQEVSLTLSTEESSSSALHLNVDSAGSIKLDSSNQTEKEGNENFYIALQSNKQTSKQIEDVALKLGIEGINPNQKLFIRGKSLTPTITNKKLDDKPLASSTPMFPPANTIQKKFFDGKNMSKSNTSTRSFDRMSETSEDFKYKIPSSPSASSSSSANLYKRQSSKSRSKLEFCIPVNVTEFPNVHSPAQMVEAPIFHPNEKEFQDPIEYIEKIRLQAEKFGICRIIPPANFKPECKVADDMRFTAYNQYVHKMLYRWGPNFKELMAIKKYLETQNITLTQSPWIGGMEIDLPRLYQTVQSLGGLKEVIEKKKWPKVSESMKIPKSAQDRVTKLDDIYCKYLLPYDTLSPDEREKLFDEVETEWAKKESRLLMRSQQHIDKVQSIPTYSDSESDDETEECIVKGRNMALNAFYRIARNTMSMWFKTPEPLAQDVEQEFWKHVSLRQNHICVHSGSIDSGNWGYGFAVSKNSPFARHAWNLKVLTNNSGSVLRSMGPIMGVTVPTLHVGMVFSACCWYRDPHSLPWIEYLHTGGNKIWYGIPDSISEKFHATLLKIVPNYCLNKSLWLPSDTVMVPPNVLVENGVSLCRTVQEPGQFVVIFPKAFTSSISTGYVVSESVYFAPPNWLNTAQSAFDELKKSCESCMFSYDRLLLNIAADFRSSVDVLKQIIPSINNLCVREKGNRQKLKQLGVTEIEKLPQPDAPGVRRRKKLKESDGEYECEICRCNLFVSLIAQDDIVYCLEHAIKHIETQKIEAKSCKLLFTYDYDELDKLVDKVKVAIENKLQKKIIGKFSGMPTLLK